MAEHNGRGEELENGQRPSDYLGRSTPADLRAAITIDLDAVSKAFFQAQAAYRAMDDAQTHIKAFRKMSRGETSPSVLKAMSAALDAALESLRLAQQCWSRALGAVAELQEDQGGVY
jgi:hypothetical protein